MREIKFRAWDKTLKRMTAEIHIGTFISTITLSDYEIMQSTGLKGKRGREIFEGDVVVYDGDIEDPDCRYVVEWNKDSAMFEMDGGEPLGDADVNGLVVLGNIYENPELI